MAVSPGGRPADASPLGQGKGPRRLDDYVRMVAHALMRKNPSWTEGHAIAVARNSIKRFLAKSKNPAVKAGAAASISNQAALDARHSLTTPLAFKEIIDMAVLTTAKRKRLKRSSFAVPKGKGSNPGKDSYPVNDKVHQKNALARVAQHGTPAEKRLVLAAVRRKNAGLAARSKLANLVNAAGVDVDLAGPQRFKHGWIPIGPGGAAGKPKSKGAPKLPKTPNASALQKERDARAEGATKTARKNLAPSEVDPKIKNAETMFGTDRSKWSPGALRSAAKLGDANARTEIARRQRIGTMK